MNKHESKYFNTALLFNQALVEILNKKDYDFITINEICKKAGVNRSTFYLHYDNLDDLLCETIENINKKFVSYFPKNSEEVLKNINTSDINNLIFITPEFLIPYLNYIKENKIIYSVSIKHPTKMQSIEKYNLLNSKIIFPILKKFDIKENEFKFFSAYYINGISAIVNEWIKNNCKEDVDFVCNLITKCVRPHT